ncbi:TAXI family TRAP transporter solute-binding subunit [Minwuia thermotolerans]|uniref:C4-dicarboxylate ABC transporter substrate-binding protein n=1 Tax=Minwuia thermotolerans TaxID=2056226 RepID=A0A2M9FYU3_9PROT|nr:TAXI family TRAP transporter solute-binding subunit [Minwuia thermotolerans]PJK28628.1 hypothetical protein CVT23_16060 [Minwuia thermotolerans]
MVRALPIAVLLALLLTTPLAAQERQRLVIATGSITGLYYAAGNAICRVLERRPGNRFDCSVMETAGSGENLDLLHAGRADLAMAQSDVLAARPGAGERLAIAALYPEVFQVVGRRGLGMAFAADALAHRFNIGMPGSGTRLTLEALMRTNDIDLTDFADPVELSGAEEASAFCRGRIDGFVFLSGIPNSKIASVLKNCDGAILGFVRSNVADFVRGRRGIDFFRFRRNTYPEMTETLDTFAVTALLVASPRTEDSMVREILGAMLTDIDWFTRLHPAWGQLLPAEMALNMERQMMHPAAETVYVANAIISE